MNTQAASEPDSPDDDVVAVRYLRFLKHESGHARFWVVARDSRGAQVWVEMGLEAHDYRQCATRGAKNGCPYLEIGCL